MAAPVESGFPDVQYLKQFAKDKLVHLLETMSGEKDLVLEAELMKPIDRIAGASILKQHGVNKIYKLEAAGKFVQPSSQRLYLVRPAMLTMQWIANHINAELLQNQTRKYMIIVVPRKLHICDTILEHEGVYGHVTVHEYPLDLIPLDHDLLSLEIPDTLPSFFLHNDQSWFHTMAKSLVNLQQIFGLIPNVHVQGTCAKAVYDLTRTMFETVGEPKQLNCEIGHAILIDRDVDFVTPLCSQVTYEGLLDDTFGINSGIIEFDSDVTGRQGKEKLLLTSQDETFEEIRHRHFTNVFGYLSSEAKKLQKGYAKKDNLTSVTAMKDFVANDLRGLKSQHKSLTTHIGACEVILKNKNKGDFEEQLRTEHSILENSDTKGVLQYLEDHINCQQDRSTCLRLLCLMSLTQGGLQPTVYSAMKTYFLQSHGFEHLITFFNLKKLGLLTEQEQKVAPSGKPLGKMAAIAALPKKSSFQAVCKRWNLIPKSAENISLQNPNDMSYVFSGAYTPLSCKFIEQVLLRGTTEGMDEVTKNLPGVTMSKLRPSSAKGRAQGSPMTSLSSRVVLVYFFGGCTYSERAALKFLEKTKGYRFLIATTNILNGNSLIDMMSHS